MRGACACARVQAACATILFRYAQPCLMPSMLNDEVCGAMDLTPAQQDFMPRCCVLLGVAMSFALFHLHSVVHVHREGFKRHASREALW